MAETVNIVGVTTTECLGRDEAKAFIRGMTAGVKHVMKNPNDGQRMLDLLDQAQTTLNTKINIYV